MRLDRTRQLQRRTSPTQRRTPRTHARARLKYVFEELESRTLLADPTSLDSTIQAAAMGAGSALQSAIGAIDSELFNVVLGHTLPLVGTAIKAEAGTADDQFGPLGAALKTQFDALAGKATIAPGDIQSALSTAFGSNLSTVTPVLTPSPGDSTIANQVQYNMDIKGTLVTSSFKPDFNLGLPALKLSVDGKVATTLTYEFKLDLGFDDKGLYFDTKPSDVDHALALTLDVTTPDLTAAAGVLGFLQLSATDVGGTNATHFHGVFTVDMTSADGHLALPSQTPTFAATLTGDARVDLNTTLSFKGSTDFPSLTAELVVTWPFSGSTVDAGNSLAGFGTEPQVEFDNIELDVGSFFNNLVGPVLHDVKTVLDPIQPLLDILTARIPVLSDIPGATSLLTKSDSIVTLKDLIDKFEPGTASTFLDAVIAVDKIVKDVPSGVASIMIPLGSFNLLGSSVDARTADLSKVTLTQGGDAPATVLAAVKGVSPALADFVNSITVGNATALGGAGGDDGGIDFPLIEDPKLAFGMLLGQDVDLFKFDMPALDWKLPIDEFLPILGPLGVELKGTIDNANDALIADAQLSFGYDTHGAAEFAADNFAAGKATDLLDGFYVDSGDAGSQVSLQLGIGAFAALNLIVFDAGVGGGISGDATMTLNDPNNDGKLRYNEIKADLGQGPLNIFDVSGELTAGLEAFIKIGFDTPLGFVGYEDDFDIATTVLLDFRPKPTPMPVLAQFVGDPGDGVLQLNIGQNAAARGAGDLSNHDETFSVVDAGGTPGDETVNVTAFGNTDTYQHVKKIVADCGDGDLILINLKVSAAADLKAGAGVTGVHLSYLGSGDASLAALGPNAQMTGGAGNNTFTGGVGGALMIGGTGRNTFYGGISVPAGGNGDTFVAGPGDDVMNGGNGPDHFIAGAGNDVMNGGTADDVFSWSVGHGVPTIVANAAYHNSLDVSGQKAELNIFKIDPTATGGVTVNANGVVFSASGIVLLNIDPGQGTDTTTIDDLTNTTLKVVGVNTGELQKTSTRTGNASDSTSIVGSSADRTVSIDEFSGTVTTGIDAMGVPQTASGTVTRIQGIGPQILVSNAHDALFVYPGNGHDTTSIATKTQTGALTVSTGGGVNEIDVRSTAGPTTVITASGADTINVGAAAPSTSSASWTASVAR